EVIGHIQGAKPPVVLVDLTPLNYMGSAMVALIVRIWKAVQERNGRMAVVNTDPVVHDVLKIAGLTNLWSIVETRAEAFDELGISPGVRAHQRETRLMVAIAPVALVLAGVGLYLWLSGATLFSTLIIVCVTLGWAALALLAGGVTAARYEGGTRALGVLVVLGAIAVCVVGALNWPDFSDSETPVVAPKP
ncbi:MAG: STAS domain-containing protein, partial [Planctomycetes bacterium]|nr:STAS domain-containing protein [Planctomycetota bacterium]